MTSGWFNSSRQFLVVFLVIVTPVAAVVADDATAEKSPLIRSVVQKSLPVIVSGGADWISDKDCLSCHRVSFTVWSLNRASEKGFDVDQSQLDEWNRWATTWQNLVNPKRRADTKMKAALTSESDTVAQLLLGKPQGHEGKKSDWFKNYRSHLLQSQQPAGFWKSVGQLPKQKRPFRETQEVTTMWTLLALQSNSESDDELKKASQKAATWLGNKTQGKSTEWWATRMLWERSEGRDSADQTRAELLKKQHEDGGWGWLTDDKSDALGTGIALYALSQDGVSIDHPAVQSAIQFLATTQNEDGSWSVNGTKKATQDDETDTASYWGACWAVIALTEFTEATTVVAK